MAVTLSRCALLAFVLLPAAGPIAAQTAASPAPADRDARRLLQRFVEDAAIVPGGWVEGQFNYANLPDDNDRWSLGGLLAFKVTEQMEAGLRLGYLSVDADPQPEGSGLSDIDLYAKYRFHGGAGRCALGGLIKAPTADEQEGIGTGKVDVEGFYACRADLQSVTLAGNLGARYNGDPDPPLPPANASVLAGGALLLPVGAQITFLIEATYESERLDGAGSDARLTFGFQGVAESPGFGFRGGVGLPLSEGAPDYEVLFGAVYLY